MARQSPNEFRTVFNSFDNEKDRGIIKDLLDLILDFKDMRSRVTLLLIIDFFDGLLTAVQTPAFRAFLEQLLLERLAVVLNYFIEYDLDTKGIANLSYYLEEEFKDKFEV